MNRGLTLVETLAVCVIITTLAALGSPALVASVRSAKSTSAMNKLKQLHLATKLYQIDNGGDGKYGTATEMGLPTEWELYKRGAYKQISSSEDLWQPACGVHPEVQPGPVKYIYGPGDHEGAKEYYKKYEENAMLFVDKNCTDTGVSMHTMGSPKLLVGVRLSGQAQRKTVYGIADLLEDNWNR